MLFSKKSKDCVGDKFSELEKRMVLARFACTKRQTMLEGVPLM